MVTSAAAMSSGSPASEERKALALPWKVVTRDCGLAALLLDLPDGVDRVAESDARLQIEGYGRRREQPLVVDHDRRRRDVAVDQRAERHLLRGSKNSHRYR